MKTYKVLLYISAILAISGNEYWGWFFAGGIFLAFLNASTFFEEED